MTNEVRHGSDHEITRRQSVCRRALDTQRNQLYMAILDLETEVQFYPPILPSGPAEIKQQDQ